MRKALGIDVGGTKVYNAIINENGEIVSEIEKHHTPKTFDEIKKLFEEIIKKHESEVDVIAFSTCGAVNRHMTGFWVRLGILQKNIRQWILQVLVQSLFLLKTTQIARLGLNM